MFMRGFDVFMSFRSSLPFFLRIRPRAKQENARQRRDLGNPSSMDLPPLWSQDEQLSCSHLSAGRRCSSNF
jgi:hypothetical protein